MKLTLRQSHLSIDQLQDVTINDFTILTGVNGSGKSHLLDALLQKKIAIDDEQRPLRLVKFSFETFKLENEGPLNAQQISSEREEVWNHFTHHILPTLRNLKPQIPEYDLKKQACAEAGTSLWEKTDENYRNAVEQFFANNPQAKGHPGRAAAKSGLKEFEAACAR